MTTENEDSTPETTEPSNTGAVARLLEVAARNADKLLAESKAEADQIVASARAEADQPELQHRADHGIRRNTANLRGLQLLEGPLLGMSIDKDRAL